MKMIEIKDTYINKHLNLVMPYFNAVQTAWQDGDITALQLHKKTTYLFRQNLNGVHDGTLEFNNKPLLTLSGDHAIYLSSEFAPKEGIQQPRFLIKINNFNNDYTSNNWTLINLTNTNKFDQYNDQHSAKLLTEFEGIYLDTMRPNNNVYQIIAYHDPTDTNKTIKNIIWHITW